MIYFLYTTLILSVTAMLFLFNPLSMGLMILINTLLICLISGMIAKSYWFSYILFLTFLGGMLVMFIYMCSIASNDIFKLSFKNMMIYSIMFTMIFIMIIYFYNYKKNSFNMIYNLEMNELMEKFLFFNNENKTNILKLYNNQNYKLTLMLIIYLLISLIAVVKIINNTFGSLRSSY